MRALRRFTVRAALPEGQDPNDLRIGSAEIVEARWFGPNDLPELQFETASALVALARAARAQSQRPLPDPVWPRF